MKLVFLTIFFFGLLYALNGNPLNEINFNEKNLEDKDFANVQNSDGSNQIDLPIDNLPLEIKAELDELKST